METDAIEVLRAEYKRTEQHLKGLKKALQAMHQYNDGVPRKPRRKLSAKSRAKIAAAQRARWAKLKRE